MKTKQVLLAVTIATAMTAAPAQADLASSTGDLLNTITFDDFDGLVGTGPTQVGTSTGFDVVFTASMSSTLGASIADLGSNGLWGAGKVFAATGSDEATGFGLLHYTFTDKVTQGVGAELNAFDGGPILLVAYGADTTILEAHVVNVPTPGGFNEGSFFGISRPSADIRAIAFGGTGLVMDDLTFTTPVPEPGTWAMMATGIGLVLMRLRGRQRRMGAASLQKM